MMVFVGFLGGEGVQDGSGGLSVAMFADDGLCRKKEWGSAFLYILLKRARANPLTMNSLHEGYDITNHFMATMDSTGMLG